MDSLKNPKPATITVAKRIIYCKMPYVSNRDNKYFEKTMAEICKEFFPHINLRLIFINGFSIARMFPFKDRIPKCVRSNVVYKYCCGICNSTYIGETTRHYNTRVAEHMGISPLTGAPSANISSKTYKHFSDTGHRVKEEYFSILYSKDPLDLEISESIAIHQYNPCINEKGSSIPLKILG